tara:strand:- start:1217 stop:1450 length:234 start_codon:yes stop_codon:yes gene_type:complete
MGLPYGLDAEVIIGYLMVFILSVIVLVYLGYDISWFIASSKKKKRGSKVVKGKESENGVKEKGKESKVPEIRKGEVK